LPENLPDRLCFEPGERDGINLVVVERDWGVFPIGEIPRDGLVVDAEPSLGSPK
jgi:hypothetical protein